MSFSNDAQRLPDCPHLRVNAPGSKGRFAFFFGNYRRLFRKFRSYPRKGNSSDCRRRPLISAKPSPLNGPAGIAGSIEPVVNPRIAR